MMKFEKLFISDIDNTLLGDISALVELTNLLRNSNVNLGIGVASGRSLNSAVDILRQNNFVEPDFIISSVGSEIFIKQNVNNLYENFDKWTENLSQGWNRDEIVKSLKDFKDIIMQPESEQKEHKISYHINEETDIERVKNKLNTLDQKLKIIVSTGRDLDILPGKSGKGMAIEFLAGYFQIPLDSILVSGDSGNDEDMLIVGTKAVVVGNYSRELERLKGNERIYFATKKYADGILEGMKHCKFLPGIS